MTPLKDTRRIQVAAVGLAFALFGAIDLVILFFTPGTARGGVAIHAVFSGIVVLFTLPWLLALFERQQVRIERQQTEIDTLHAMDSAIFAELDLSRLLSVAADKALTACDADASGVALFNPDSGKLVNDAYRMPDIAGDDARNRFMSLVRGGSVSGNDEWETLVAPLNQSPTARVDGYLLVARRRINVRPFGNTDTRLLEALSGTLRIAVTNARALAAARETQNIRDELKVTQERQRRDQALARAMTEGLLPEIPERIGSWVFSQVYQAQSDEAPVGGDLYDLFQIAPQKWGVFIADVSGKGLAAARKIALVKYALRSYAREHPSPAEVLNHLNITLFDEPEMTGFVTLFYAVLDETEETIVWASAGHETPVLRRANGDCEIMDPTGPVLGAMIDIVYHERRTTFHTGDGLLLFTDGFSEARSAIDRRDMLEIEGVQRELEVVCETISRATDAAKPPLPVANALMEALQKFTGGKLSDDTALLWMQYAPGHEKPLPLGAHAP